MAKISKTTMDKMIKHNRKGGTTVVQLAVGDGETVEVSVRNAISLTDWADAINAAVAAQFAVDETGVEAHVPEMADFAKWVVALKYYTDFDVELKIGKDGAPDEKAIERLWALYWIKDLRDAVVDAAADLWWAIDDAISERKNAVNTLQLAFWAKLNQIADTVQKDFGELDEDGAADLMNVVQKLGELDQGKIVELMQASGEKKE